MKGAIAKNSKSCSKKSKSFSLDACFASMDRAFKKSGVDDDALKQALQDFEDEKVGLKYDALEVKKGACFNCGNTDSRNWQRSGDKCSYACDGCGACHSFHQELSFGEKPM